MGVSALEAITTGGTNTAVGVNAGNTLTTGDNNTIFGYNTDSTGGGGANRLGFGVSLSLDTNNQVKIGVSTNFITNNFASNATWTHSSDERLKENIENDSLGLSFITDLRTVTFNWKKKEDIPEEIVGEHPAERDTETQQHGLIAQEVKASLDKLGVEEFAGWSEGEGGTQMVSEAMFVYPLIKAVQELSDQVEDLKAEIETLKGG